MRRIGNFVEDCCANGTAVAVPAGLVPYDVAELAIQMKTHRNADKSDGNEEKHVKGNFRGNNIEPPFDILSAVTDVNSA